MKRIWMKVCVLIIAVVLQNLLCIPQASFLTEKHNDEKEKLNQKYMNDWHVQMDSFSNSNERDCSVSRNENLSNGIPIKPIVCSTSGPMDSAWPMQSHDVHHTGLSPYSTVNNSGVEKWRFYTGGEIEGSSAVVDKNGIIYFGTMGSEHTLFALYPNGTQKWKYKVDGLICSTPTIAEDGTIYVATWGGSYGGYLYAISSDGMLKWVFWHIDSIACSPTIGSDGTIYFGTMAGYFFAVNPNGIELWRLYLGGSLISSPAIGTDNIIYIGTTSHYLYAVNPNGTLRWQFGAGQFKGNPSIAEDGTIYAPSFDGYLYALYPNSTMKWRASTGGSVSGAGVALAEDGIIYVGTELLRAYYPNGTLKWSADVQGDIYGTVPAVSADGTIYMSASRDLVAVNPDGTERWRHQVAEYNAYSSPCIGADGSIYVGSTWGGGAWVYGYFHSIGSGESKKIEIQSPEPGKIYFFGREIGLTPKNNTFIIGSVKVQVRVYSEAEIISIHFYVDGTDQYFVTKPPYEWNMNRRYGNLLPLKHTIMITGYYEGGINWSESIDVLYFHLLRN